MFIIPFNWYFLWTNQYLFVFTIYIHLPLVWYFKKFTLTFRNMFLSWPLVFSFWLCIIAFYYSTYTLLKLKALILVLSSIFSLILLFFYILFSSQPNSRPNICSHSALSWSVWAGSHPLLAITAKANGKRQTAAKKDRWPK